MKEVMEFLNKNRPYFVATVDNDKPKVRPFGFSMEYEGKLWFATNNKKKVFKQLKANPNIEISAFSTNGEWIRISGKAVFDYTTDTKAKALEVSPKLASMYKIDDSTFELFYIDEGEAILTSQVTGDSKTIKF